MTEDRYLPISPRVRLALRAAWLDNIRILHRDGRIETWAAWRLLFNAGLRGRELAQHMGWAR